MSDALIEPTAVTSSMTPASARSRARRIAVRGARPLDPARGEQGEFGVPDLELDLGRATHVQFEGAQGGRQQIPAAGQVVQRLAGTVIGGRAAYAAAERAGGREAPGGRVAALGHPVPAPLRGPDPDGLDVQRECEVPGRPWPRRWRRARGEAQRRSVASAARASCSAGSSGNGKPAVGAQREEPCAARSAWLDASYSASAKSSPGMPEPCSPT